jgi:uncharacterized membrane protein YeaQ/YmgE (transglycosylase-associated protein family)
VNIILWLIFGAVAGWIASMIAGTNRQQGLLMDIVVGVIGAIVGGFLYSTITGVPFAAGFNLMSLIVAIVGAVVLLFILKAVRRTA